MISNKLKAYSLLFSVSYWTIVAFYFVTIRYVGLGEFTPPELNYTELALYAGVVGICIGVLFALIPLNKLLKRRERRSFANVVLISTMCYVGFFVLVIFSASLVGNTIEFAINYVLGPEGLIILLHLSTCSLLYHFILQINKKFGPLVLVEYTLGKYFAPKIEERAFMFIDLKSSTTLAETLEHVNYSRLIQDCYAELTLPLLQYDAQVYQYVGDEIVVSWEINKTFTGSRCSDFYFAFQSQIDAKRDYFIKEYGALPSFKAGAHCGTVTVAEVGEIKTEIAYHGDVLNTASRIQNLCNKYESRLLISESLRNLIRNDYPREIRFIAETELRGKENRTRLYSVGEISQDSNH